MKSKKRIEYIIPITTITLGILILGTNEAQAASLPNLLGCESISGCILYMTKGLKGIVAGVAAVAIIIAGIIYLFSGANVALATKAKKALVGAALGLAIVLGAEILLHEVGAALGWSEAKPEGEGVIKRAIEFVLGILGFIAMGGMIIGGIFYLTSAGDTPRAEKGKKAFYYSTIGLAIALSAVIIIRQIERIVSSN